jgi:hypothetical protein
MKYNIGGKYSVIYNRDGIDELLGVYSTKKRAEKAADKIADRVAYGTIQIEGPAGRYEYWPAYRAPQHSNIMHIGKNIAIVPFDEMDKRGRMDAKHYISGEHERERAKSKKKLKA